MTTDAFIHWLEEVKTEHAEGSSVKLAALLGLKGRGTVGEWERGNNAPSARSCQLLAALTGQSWLWIADLAGAELRHGNGNRRDDRGEVELPRLAPEVDPLDVTLWEGKHQGCTGCRDKPYQQDEHRDRRIICDILLKYQLPTPCTPWDVGAIGRLVHLLEGD